MESVAQKLKFARLAETIGLPVPRTVEITPGLTPQAVTTQLGFPMLRKPVIGMSGGGIELIRDEAALRSSLGEPGVAGQFMLQEKVPGEDVALTLLADRGEVFAVMLRKRWFTRRKATAFAPIQDVEFFACEWLEHLGRRFVAATQYSGIADFDLKVDFERRRAWFLESDPRFMGGLAGAERFGLNVPLLLIARTLGLIPPGTCVRTTSGHFLSTPSIPEWLVSGGWRRPRHGRICTNLRTQLSDPLATIARMKDFVVHSF
jgi:biotin carboxylase